MTQKEKRSFVDRAFIVFLLWQCEAFFVALRRAYGETDEARRASDLSRRANFFMGQRAFNDFASAIMFAANIGKMLWPRSLRVDERAAALSRSRRLRKLLHIRTRIRIFDRVTEIRNSFEHLDVRLDLWAARTSGTVLVHGLSRELPRIPDVDRINRFDPGTKYLRMLGDKISLLKLEAIIWKIWRAAIAANRHIEDNLMPTEPHL